MTTKLKPITAEELLKMPKDGSRYELIRGVLVEKMPPGHEHGRVMLRIGSILTYYADANDYGLTVGGDPGYLLDRDPDTVRAPDVAWLAPDRVPPGTLGYPELAPDLAVEVKSPSNSNPEMAAKATMWLSYGSREVWVADPQATTVTVFRPGASPHTLTEREDLDGGGLLPGFTTPVWRLFRRSP